LNRKTNVSLFEEGDLIEQLLRVCADLRTDWVQAWTNRADSFFSIAQKAALCTEKREDLVFLVSDHENMPPMNQRAGGRQVET
jgi:hypothetical protein